jgi:hypothetical protein
MAQLGLDLGGYRRQCDHDLFGSALYLIRRYIEVFVRRRRVLERKLQSVGIGGWGFGHQVGSIGFHVPAPDFLAFLKCFARLRSFFTLFCGYREGAVAFEAL